MVFINTNKESISIEKISELLKKSETDDGTFYSSLYDLYFFIGILKGINDVNNDRALTLEESRERMMKKYESYNTKYGS